MRGNPDAVIVGSGPNGLAAAVTLSAAGLKVLVIEGAPTIGGGCRTEELTLPGFWHDVCSAGHPLALASPFFRRFDLPARGVRFASAPVEFAQPLDGGRAAVVTRSVEETAARLGADRRAYRRLFGPPTRHMDQILPELLAPLRRVPAHPLAMVSYGSRAILPAATVVRTWRTPEARAVMAGTAAHAMMPLTAVPTAGIGIMLVSLAHAVGWPVVAGGSARITDAMAEAVIEAGGEHRDRSLGPLPGRTPARQRHPPRRVTPRAHRPGRRPPPVPVPSGAAPVPLRGRGLQGGLRAVRPGALDERGLP